MTSCIGSTDTKRLLINLKGYNTEQYHLGQQGSGQVQRKAVEQKEEWHTNTAKICCVVTLTLHTCNSLLIYQEMSLIGLRMLTMQSIIIST